MISESQQTIRLTDCPRDAMQGVSTFIPTRRKIQYINQLMEVGFDILDFGSFVSPEAIPQMRDTEEVLGEIEINSDTKLLAIVGNIRGALRAVKFDKISWLGYPFSVSETFLKRNLNSSTQKAFGQTCELLNLGAIHQKKLMVYLSMGFGNPYNDPWSIDLLAEWIEKLHREGITNINLSDTIGISTAKTVGETFSLLLYEFPEIEFGFHLHSKPDEWYSRIDAAWRNGCRSFDGVLLGGGGCPMTGVGLVENLAMQHLVSFFAEREVPLKINNDKYQGAAKESDRLFRDIKSDFNN